MSILQQLVEEIMGRKSVEVPMQPAGEAMHSPCSACEEANKKLEGERDSYKAQLDAVSAELSGLKATAARAGQEQAMKATTEGNITPAEQDNVQLVWQAVAALDTIQGGKKLQDAFKAVLQSPPSPVIGKVLAQPQGTSATTPLTDEQVKAEVARLKGLTL